MHSKIPLKVRKPPYSGCLQVVQSTSSTSLLHIDIHSCYPAAIWLTLASWQSFSIDYTISFINPAAICLHPDSCVFMNSTFIFLSRSSTICIVSTLRCFSSVTLVSASSEPMKLPDICSLLLSARVFHLPHSGRPLSFHFATCFFVALWEIVVGTSGNTSLPRDVFLY